MAVVVIVGATVFLTDGGEEKEVVKNKEEYGQGGEGFPEIHEKDNKDNKAQNVPGSDNDIKNEK